jgi:TRAP-type C4-dicarboxylate transport system permease large subunit
LTATESTAVAVSYAILISTLQGAMIFVRFWDALVSTTVATSSIMFITAKVSIVAFVFAPDLARASRRGSQRPIG